MNLYNDAFDQHEYEYLRQDMTQIFQNPSTQYVTSWTGWMTVLIPENPIAPILIKPLKGEEFSQQREIIIKAFRKYSGLYELDESNVHMNYHFWLGGSSIEWHDDGGKVAATFYMNDDWNTDDGGFLVYQDSVDGTMRAVPPTPNTCAILRNELHSVSMTPRNAPVRMTIQVFYEDNC